MAEGRMLLKKTSLSEDIADLKNDTHRVLFFMALPHLDIKGRMEGSWRKFKATICPLLDHIGEKQINAFFDDAQNLGLIQIYRARNAENGSVKDSIILSFPTFLKNQPKLNPDKEAKSRFPDPPEISHTSGNSGVTQEYAGATTENSALSLNLSSNSKEEKHCRASERFDQIPYSEIIAYLNVKAGKSFRWQAKETKAHIKARWEAGFRLEEFKRVIDIKCGKWLTDANMSQYLRPQTLFGTKFESYLNENGSSHTKSVWDD